MSVDPPDEPKPIIMHWKICRLPYLHYPHARVFPLEVEMSNNLTLQKKAVIDALNRSQKCQLTGIAEFDMVAEIRDSKRQNPLSLRMITKQCLHKERVVYYYPNGRIRAADYQPSAEDLLQEERQEDAETKIHNYIIKLYEIYDGLETLPANYVRDIAMRNMNDGKLPEQATFTPDEEKQVRKKVKGKQESAQLGRNMSDGMAGIISFVPIHTVPILTAVADRLRRTEGAKERQPETNEPETMRLPDDPWSTILLQPPKGGKRESGSARGGTAPGGTPTRSGGSAVSVAGGACGSAGAGGATGAAGASGVSDSFIPPPPPPIPKASFRYSSDPAKVQPYSGLGLSDLLPPSLGLGKPGFGGEGGLDSLEMIKMEQLGFGRRLLGIEGDVKEVKRYLAFLAHQQEVLMTGLARLTDALVTPPDFPSEQLSEQPSDQTSEHQTEHQTERQSEHQSEQSDLQADHSENHSGDHLSDHPNDPLGEALEILPDSSPSSQSLELQGSSTPS